MAIPGNTEFKNESMYNVAVPIAAACRQTARSWECLAALDVAMDLFNANQMFQEAFQCTFAIS